MTDREALQATLAEIIDLLVAHGDTYVVDRLQGYQARLQTDGAGVTRTLYAEVSGGSGSLRDRYLCAANGDRIIEAEERTVNARLNSLVERLAQQTRPARLSGLLS